MGSTYRSLGESELARVQLELSRSVFERELGPHSDGVLDARRELGWLDEQAGNYDQARETFGEILIAQGERHGVDSREYLDAAEDLVQILLEAEATSEAYEILTELLARIRALEAEDPLRSLFLSDMGVAEHARGNHEAAEPYLVESLELDLKNLGTETHPRHGRATDTGFALSRAGSL